MTYEAHFIYTEMYVVNFIIGPKIPINKEHVEIYEFTMLSQTINRNRRPTCYVSICATAAAVASSDSEIPLPISSLS